MAPPGDLDALSPTDLKALVVRLLGKVAALEQTGAAQRAEIARLKGLKGRPALKPSGMEKASEPKPPSPPKGRRGPVTPRVAVEDQLIKASVPPGSRFKGYADFVVQDLVLNDEIGVALKPRAGWHRCLDKLVFDGYARRHRATAALGRAGRLRLAGLLHPTWFERWSALQPFEPRDLCALGRHCLLQARHLAQQLDDKRLQLGRGKGVQVIG